MIAQGTRSIQLQMRRDGQSGEMGVRSEKKNRLSGHAQKKKKKLLQTERNGRQFEIYKKKIDSNHLVTMNNIKLYPAKYIH